MLASIKARTKTIVIPLLIVLTAIVLFVFFKSTKPVQAPLEVKEKVWMVESMVSKFERLAPMQTLYGKVESNAMVSAAAPISGVIDQVWVKEGQFVKAGQPLVSMSLSDLDIPIAQAQADAEDAKAQARLQQLTNKANIKRLAHEKQVLALKHLKLERTQQLIAKDLASQSDLDLVNESLVKQEYVVVGAQLAVEENRLKVAQHQARLAKAEAALKQARLNKQRGLLVAPFDARIASVSVSEGSRVGLGAEMVRYYALSSLELRAKLPTTIVKNVQKGLNSSNGLAALYGQDKVTTSLVLSRLAGQATTSGVDAFFTVPTTLKNIRPGDLMEVRLQGVLLDQVVAVPYSALYGQDQLYLIKEGRLVAQSVQVVGDVLREGQLWALIVPSFKAGSVICVTHLPNAVTGLKVSEVSR